MREEGGVINMAKVRAMVVGVVVGVVVVAAPYIDYAALLHHTINTTP